MFSHQAKTPETRLGKFTTVMNGAAGERAYGPSDLPDTRGR